MENAEELVNYQEMALTYWLQYQLDQHKAYVQIVKKYQTNISFNNSYLFDHLGDSNKLDHDH